MIFRRTQWFLVLIFLVGIAVGALGTWVWFWKPAPDCQTYQWINYRFWCGETSVLSKRGYRELQTELEAYIEKKQQDGISQVSLYFRDLHDGPTLGIREEELFTPASLLKTPLMLTYLRLAEDNESLLHTKLVHEGSVSLAQQIAPKETIIPDVPYTVEDLLRRMIVYSDNQSYFVLLEYLHNKFSSRDELLATLHDLGIIDPTSNIEDTVTVRGYASIFRLLYNASYLSQSKSEFALSLLAQSDWKEGIVSGVPTTIEVAHKFGERSEEGSTVKQLHDCGIVYYPGNPYLLCIMTRGDDMNALSGAIAKMSEMVYKEVESRKITAR